MKTVALTVASLLIHAAAADYRVHVGGREISLTEAPKPTKYWKGQMYDQYAQPYWAAIVDAEGEIEVKIESDVHDMSKANIMPLKDSMRVVKRGKREFVFKAKVPFKVSVEPQCRYRSLKVIARKPDPAPPRRDEERVRYFGPGRHRLDAPIVLGSDETLYLAYGALVEAAVFASGTNIAIRGHGVLSGAAWPWKKGPQRQFVHFKDAKNVVVEGVTLLSAYHWTLVLENVELALVKDIAVLGGRVINDDGIDICRSRGVRVTDSFFHVQDDNIAVKWWAEDVLVDRCIFWADVARIVHIGGECDPPPRGMRRIAVRDIDVLHQSICKPVRGEPVVHINASNRMTVEDVQIRGVRMWAPEKHDLFARIETVLIREAKGWAWYDEAGYVKNVTISGVEYPGTIPPKCGGVKVLGFDAGHPVSDVRISGLNYTPEREINSNTVRVVIGR